MGSAHTDVIFALAVTDEDGAFRQLVITGGEEVTLSRRERGGKLGAERVRCRPRDVRRFLDGLDRIGLVEWQHAYGEGDASGPGGWMLLLETGGRMERWQGAGGKPPQWEGLCELVRELTGEELEQD